jgi:hypothetical protein
MSDLLGLLIFETNSLFEQNYISLLPNLIKNSTQLHEAQPKDRDREHLNDAIYVGQDQNIQNLSFSVTHYPAGDGAKAIETADFNDDGVVNRYTHKAAVLFNQENGTLSNPSFSGVDETPLDVTVGDFDEAQPKDGDQEHLNDAIYVSQDQNKQNLSFSVTHYPAGDGAKAIETADFNDDGFLDFVVVNRYSHKAAVLFNQGNGTLGNPSFWDVGRTPLDVTVGDFNNDGSPDFATADSRGNSTSIFLNDTNGFFNLSSKVTLGKGFRPHGITSSDLDGNGSSDLAVVSNTDQNSVSILLNNGSGTFSVSSTISVSGSPWDVVAADLNNDGYQDLITANSLGNSISILLNNGNGSFRVADNLAVGTYPYGLNVADFNNDGFLDIGVANTRSRNISVIMNQGSGTFAPAIFYSLGNHNPKALTAGDFDSDGDLDIAVANALTETVLIMLNDGNGVFSPDITIPVGSNANSIIAGDFNNDGIIDLATANGTSDNISLAINNTFAVVSSTPNM